MSTEICTGESKVKMMMLAGAPSETFDVPRGFSSKLLQITSRGVGALPMRERASPGIGKSFYESSFYLV